VTAAAAETATSSTRWARVIDRMEHRRPDVGLRFRVPPLWLEVTMSGPDSDRWPRTDGPNREWNWQSSAACLEAMDLAAAGADDDRLLSVVSRYTVENLILNAVHEIGEWLRLDGRRLFPAHPARPQPGDGSPAYEDVDGNGRVHVEFGFPPPPAASGSSVCLPSDAEPDLEDCRPGSLAAASRFTYLPGTSVSYGPGGPVVTGPDGPTAAWHAAWSSAVRGGADAAGGSDLARIAEDVHRALVHYEADCVCRAFHVDGHRVWDVAPGHTEGRRAGDVAEPRLQPLTITILHAGRRPLAQPLHRSPSPTGVA
jgi:hypothetical protein